MAIVKGDREYFKGIGEIRYEGKDTDNPLAFRYYDENKIVAGKTMKEYLKFACSYWHSFNGNGADPFGEPTHIFPWDAKADPVERAKDKMDAAFVHYQNEPALLLLSRCGCSGLRNRYSRK